MGARHEIPDSLTGKPLLSPLVKALREAFSQLPEPDFLRFTVRDTAD